ncbi:hypothetical protein SAMN04489860_2569 [Paraoerskovia marina]|uniref:Uncharacterized protein n=1 Tax=Paraoerskovia marina TaxID=545619 RepID=A0A1H1VQ95_9CELL|nr:hypothetical protein SAMN04489860_2569 [Paraoerskovia marina]
MIAGLVYAIAVHSLIDVSFIDVQTSDESVAIHVGKASISSSAPRLNAPLRSP